MILSVVETAKRLGVNAYELLRHICEAGLQGQLITARLPLGEQAVVYEPAI